jgi:hypothetical protein
MEGRAINPILTQAVPLIPLIAANRVQIPTVPIARPPRRPPIHEYIVLYNSSARPERSNIYPINKYNGRAIIIIVVDWLRRALASIGNDPEPHRKRVKIAAVPNRLKPIGKPIANRDIIRANITILIIPISISLFSQ